jgi:hypothetical protein
MKTIYRMRNGFIHLDSYGETRKSNHLFKAVVSALLLAASISTIAALARKYTTLAPQDINTSKVYVMGY